MLKVIIPLIAAFFFTNTTRADDTIHSDILKQNLLTTENSWEGTAYNKYPNGAPEITILKVSIKPDKTLEWHSHPCISAIYMTKGNITLTIKKTGMHHTFSAGESFADTVNIEHKGKSGNSGAEMLVFFACTKNTALTIK